MGPSSLSNLCGWIWCTSVAKNTGIDYTWRKRITGSYIVNLQAYQIILHIFLKCLHQFPVLPTLKWAPIVPIFQNTWNCLIFQKFCQCSECKILSHCEFNLPFHNLNGSCTYFSNFIRYLYFLFYELINSILELDSLSLLVEDFFLIVVAFFSSFIWIMIDLYAYHFLVKCVANTISSV